MNDADSRFGDDHEPAKAEAVNGIDRDTLITGVATVGVVAIGVALIEVSLIPGMVIGVAAALAPKYLPKVGDGLQPLFRSSVRGLYKFNRKAREAAAEAKERVLDVVAEVRAEETTPPAETAPSQRT
jgi:hypothetical protein